MKPMIPKSRCSARTCTLAAAILSIAMSQAKPLEPAAPDDGNPTPPDSSPSTRVREPAVAGLFYPRDPAELGRVIDRLLASVQPTPVQGLRAVICPHAGYTYSGPTAAHAYALLKHAPVHTVIVLAPSHYAGFRGACVSSADVFRTPLGDVPVARDLAEKLVQSPPFIREGPCRVQRPTWARQSSRPIPPDGTESPDTWEHSDEVQVPFLQRALGKFRLLTIVMGDVDPAAVAQGLGKHLDPQTLIVVSSDLSHFHPDQAARTLDAQCTDAILRLDTEQMAAQEACGRGPILTLMHLARSRHWKPALLDYRNSGDTGGDKSRVVGYAALAFSDAGATPPSHDACTPEDRQRLLRLARQTLAAVTADRPLPEIDPREYPGALSAPRGCFVTLTLDGSLRGCIGNLQPRGPLCEAVRDNARNAALRDPRFPPVGPSEVDRIEIEISVLTEPRPLAFTSPEDLLAKLQPHRDGVILQIGSSTATYLPQVWEQVPDKEQFLRSLSQKAQRDPEDWRREGTRVQTYQVEAFKQPAPQP
ncbi:MAG TPA: AmmeMemoRadiSam system protein B [Verrucomicrobiota bacterium]|nr:AmmeMemoRadiSam system protein B [Verrucomicrobiota bacterium]HNU52778.1 AmmeMemoRadiSam system protein B [Verrucomicrobiota bacterium]